MSFVLWESSYEMRLLSPAMMGCVFCFFDGRLCTSFFCVVLLPIFVGFWRVVLVFIVLFVVTSRVKTGECRWQRGRT